MSLFVEQCGMLTTVQDTGRIGFRQFGVPVAGVLDRQAAMIANILVDNEEEAAVLEVTGVGPRLRFEQANVFAVTGGDLMPRLNGRDVPRCQACAAKKGDVLSFGGIRTGFRAYVAFAGGLDVPVIMGSRSTYMKGGFGGYQGRKLANEDVIPFLAPKAALSNLAARKAQPDDPQQSVCLRVVRGPQEEAFTEKGYQTFFSNAYRITNDFDRTGIKLEGETVEHVKDGNIISDGIAIGSIQVPSNGLPMIMLTDCLTTGGYTKIATICSADLGRIAQCRPGAEVRFEEISVQQAQKLYLEAREARARLRRMIAQNANNRVRQFKLLLDGEEYQVSIQEVK